MHKLLVIIIVLSGLTLSAATLLPNIPARGTVQEQEIKAAVDRPLISSYHLAQITRGRVIAKVAAIGTVQPAASVVVGSQVSGQVAEVLVDYNEVVKKGQPIAKLDQHLFAIRVEQAQAEVE